MCTEQTHLTKHKMLIILCNTDKVMLLNDCHYHVAGEGKGRILGLLQMFVLHCIIPFTVLPNQSTYTI